ncbi:MAG: PepSY protein [Nevskia sp.]|nr:PepSY protein [Nevskia sp.]
MKGRHGAGRKTDTRLRSWHQRAGVAAFAFICWLAASGILLSRSTDLGFDQTDIGWPWLMALYGLHAEAPQQGYRAGTHWLASTEACTLLDGRRLAPAIAQPLGFIVAGTQLLVATPHSLVLLSADGARIDELRAPILPVANLRRIGVLDGADGSIVVQDLDAYVSRDGGDHWRAVPIEQVHWSQTAALDDTQRQQLLPYAQPRMRVEQVLIDLHSGRLFGRVGSWIITAVGVVALWLAPSGFFMWLRARRRKRLAREREAPMQLL